MFGKKIAMLLIIFMVSGWCLFAADSTSKSDAEKKSEDEAAGYLLVALGVVVGVGLVIWLVVALVGGKDAADDFGKGYFGELPNDDSQLIPVSSSGSELPAPSPLPKTSRGNQIFDHAVFETNDDKVFVGARFSF